MRILALDAATEDCSVALLYGTEMIERTAQSGKSHSQQILSLVQELLDEAGLALSSLDALAASIGPGGFTGVRITVAVAQGLAFGANLPTLGITTLEAMALQVLQRKDEYALACLDARMGEVYWGCFGWEAGDVVATTRAAVGLPSTVHLPSGAAHLGIGRGFQAHPELQRLVGVELGAERAAGLPRAREVGRLGALRFKAGRGHDPADLQPLYVRDKVALTEAERSQA